MDIEIREDGNFITIGGAINGSKNSLSVLCQIEGKTDAEKLRCIASNMFQVADSLDGGPHYRDPIEAMMADGQVEGQWGSDAVVRQVPQEVFDQMINTPEVQKEINRRRTAEFAPPVVDGMKVTQISQEELDGKIAEGLVRTPLPTPAEQKSTAGRTSIKKSHRGEGENFVD